MHSDYVDERFKDFLGEFIVENNDVALDQPAATVRGLYWYNLHLVIVVQDRRFPVTEREKFVMLRETCFETGAVAGHAISRLAIMPDHIHLALRGHIEDAPGKIALRFMNDLSVAMGYNRCWNEEYYVGTFSEYDVRAIRLPRV